MRHLLSIPNMGSAAGLVELAVAAEARGWHGVGLWDHLQFQRGADLDILDPWVLLGAMAQATSSLRLGTLVTPAARRRPHKLAKELVTLDHLSGGRAFLGVGLGEPAGAEFEAFGEPGDAQVRAARLDESLAVLDGFVRGEPVRFDGDHLHVDAHLRPAAHTRPRPPVWVAGTWPRRKPIERALRWDGFVPVAEGGGAVPPGLAAEIAAWAEDERTRRPPDRPFDLVIFRDDDAPADAYTAIAGITWLAEMVWPVGDFQADMRRRIDAGPPD